MTSDVVLVGHPFAPIGMGEHIRCSFRAFRSAGMRPNIVDIYGLDSPEADTLEEIGPFMARGFGKVNIFHINGDEVEQALAHLGEQRLRRAYNIIYPAWELSKYPREWARQLERFDEIWAPSMFVRDSIASATSAPVFHMPLACEVALSSFLGRRYYGIPESAYVFLFFFDFRSYVTRKNPWAVVDAFRGLLQTLPLADVCLVLKTNGAAHDLQQLSAVRDAIHDVRDRTVLIDKTLTDNEVKNLVRCSDCFVSLHRSEGFGRGIAEAMYLGKPVIVTAYSGNMDFNSVDNALLVDFRTITVPPGAYPFWQEQVWADPAVASATAHMVNLVQDNSIGYRIGRRGSATMRSQFSYRAVGLRYRHRLDAILDQIQRGDSLRFQAGAQ